MSVEVSQVTNTVFIETFPHICFHLFINRTQQTQLCLQTITKTTTTLQKKKNNKMKKHNIVTVLLNRYSEEVAIFVTNQMNNKGSKMVVKKPRHW